MIAFEQLLMLVEGELDPDGAAKVDEHIIECGACASTFERLYRLAPVLDEIVRSGGMAFPVTESLADDLRKAGLISRSYRIAPDAIVPCTVTAEDIYALTTVEVDLRGVERLNVVVTLPMGPLRMQDVPFAPGSGVVSWIAQSSRLRLLPNTRVTVDVFAEEAGGERKLGRYMLDHTAFAG